MIRELSKQLISHHLLTNITYHTVISNSTAPEIIRNAMVERYYLINYNATAVAREYDTKRQTVTKWVDRFEKDGAMGLKDYSRTPHTEPVHKKPKEVENMIIALVKKKQCAKYKKTLRALRNWQIDVKELRDIPNIMALIEAKIIPNFQYTARDQLTGTMFICYGWEHTLINSIRFVSTLFEHLKQFGIHPSEITIQTDNGSEFLGNIFAKKDSGFTSLIEQVYHGKHITIPIGKKEYPAATRAARRVKEWWKALMAELNMNSMILKHLIH